MPKKSPAQKQTVGRVMHEFKHGELEAAGRHVRSPKQAIAIALSEAGASDRQSPAENRRRQSQTRQREQDMAQTRRALYRRAAEAGIPGRSRMTKADLARALEQL